MKALPCILLAVAWTGMAAAQRTGDGTTPHKTRNVLLECHTGFSLPFGKFHLADSTDDLSGYANGGFYAEISGAWLGKRGFGLTAAYTYQRQWLNPAAENITPDGHKYILGKKPWSNHYLLAGPVFASHFGKLLLQVKAEAGVVIASSSNFYMTMPVTTTDSMAPPQTILSQGSGIGVAFQGLVSLGYRLTEKLSLSLSVSYLGANPARTKDYYWYTIDQFNQLIYHGGEFQIRKKISTLTAGVGVAYRL
jgi:hypothetical protein